MFHLTKWYLDVVSDDGDVLLCYDAQLKVAGLSLSYASRLHSRCGEADVARATMHAMTRPSLAGDASAFTCKWRHDLLDVDGHWERTSPSIKRTLLDDATGTITWRCHMPRARAHVLLGETTIEGRGYVECLRLTLPRLHLPFRTLYWGRYHSAAHALVWIQWDDGRDCRFVCLDGERQPDARVASEGMDGLSTHRTLSLFSSRDLLNRPVLPAIGRVLPALLPHVDASVGALHEHKQVSRGRLLEHGTVIDEGWALHEVVHL